MTILTIIAAVVFQNGALYAGAMAWNEAGLWNPNRKRRNRYAFTCLVLSVVALLTAYSLGLRIAGC